MLNGKKFDSFFPVISVKMSQERYKVYLGCPKYPEKNFHKRVETRKERDQWHESG